MDKLDLHTVALVAFAGFVGSIMWAIFRVPDTLMWKWVKDNLDTPISKLKLKLPEPPETWKTPIPSSIQLPEMPEDPAVVAARLAIQQQRIKDAEIEQMENMDQDLLKIRRRLVELADQLVEAAEDKARDLRVHSGHSAYDDTNKIMMVSNLSESAAKVVIAINSFDRDDMEKALNDLKTEDMVEG